jgi:hypothetical protein
VVEVDDCYYRAICVGHGVLYYRQTVILRPTSKHCSANALMSCVGLPRPIIAGHFLYDIFTRSNLFCLAYYEALRRSSSNLSARARMIGICMQHNMFLTTMHDISSCCSAWFLSIVVPSRLRSYACSSLARRRGASCALLFWLFSHYFLV